MPGFEETNLWKKSLGKSKEDCGNNFRYYETLRNEYYGFRERAAKLAGEIARDLPDFTIHDASHFDELWRLADLIAGDDFDLNPMEAFVLGGAFLIHDLGLGLAAYPNGIDQLRSEPNWSDAIAVILREKFGRIPKKEEIEKADEEAIHLATEQLLRKLHSDHAESLCLVPWKDDNNTNIYYLIGNTELRNKYGPIIGKIAQSHWWPVSKLSEEFKIKIGALHPYPQEWEIDTLKLACLLRVADASHLDSSRAHGFLKAIRKPKGYSKEHWIFQEHLQQPYIKNCRLVFTSGDKFPIDESASWWLCFDMLKMVDRELHQVDALLADSGQKRLAANGVAGVESAERMSEFIQTENWMPVNAQIKITDVPRLVLKFGGKELYGNDLTVPLRELIQNASDSIRARRIIEDRPSNWGDIIVRLGKDSEGDWIEVEDTGIGMSTEVLTGPLLDFGNSYWGSSLMVNEFPGLISKGLQSSGKYGIGFFSVFMLGDRVHVTSRRSDFALRDTQVLEIDCGIDSRPILRKAEVSECIRDGGTKVRVWLKSPPEDGLLRPTERDRACSIEELCEWLCPCLDVNFYVEKENLRRKLVIASSDWTTIPCDKLLKRISILEKGSEDIWAKNIALIKDIIRPILDKSGRVISRACILPYSIFEHDESAYYDLSGIVCADGFRSSDISGIAGIFIGEIIGVARDIAIPVVDREALAKWASEQANLVSDLIEDPEDQAYCANIVRICGGSTGKLKIAKSAQGWLDAKQIIQIFRPIDELLLIGSSDLDYLTDKFGAIKLNDNVLSTNDSSVTIFNSIFSSTKSNERIEWPESSLDKGYGIPYRKFLEGAILDSLVKSWSTTLDCIMKIAEKSANGKRIIREIGEANGKPISAEIDKIIKRP